MNDLVSAPRARSWLGQAPIAPAILALGGLLSVVAWLGLRSVEESQADVAYERVLLAQSSELQSEVERHVRGIDGLRVRIQEDGVPTTASVSRFLNTVGLSSNQVLVIEEVLTAEEMSELREREADNEAFLENYSPESGSHFAVTRISGYEDNSLLGTSFTASGEFRALMGEATLINETIAVPGAELPDELVGVDESALLIAGPITDRGGDLDGAVIGQLMLDRVVGDMATIGEEDQPAFELTVNGEVVASTRQDGELGEPFGQPVQFTEEDTLWGIQGFSDGIDVDRRSSWLVLFAGLVITGLAATFALAMRRHALTLGRLERSEHDARHDELTGLLNRSGLTEELADILRDRRGNDLIGVLFLDLDRLKVVNDSIGHSAGDEVLSAVSQRLEGIIRDDDVIGRFGGDEFVVVSQGVPAVNDLTTLAERVLEVLKEPAILSDESSQMISASIGIAYVAKGEATAEDLLRDADLAMYRAKEGGGSRYEVFDDEMRSQAVARLEVERELRRAIRTGQLVVHYQPIVDVRTGNVDRLEALVRWQHPVRGMIPPGAFLSVAAESGLIVDLGEHVLREACRQAAMWSSAVGREIMVSVNVAERQLIDAGLVDTVRRVLAETGVKPSQLELEITEELIVDRLDHRLTVLHELVEMGIKLAIDDFGTSRASLGQLKRLDMVSTLKIDRAFVIDVANDIVDRKIITAIVALADSVGMEVIAEGVEDVEQVAVLRQLGIDRIQGFYFQRPGPSQQMVTLLNKQFDVPEPANTAL